MRSPAQHRLALSKRSPGCTPPVKSMSFLSCSARELPAMLLLPPRRRRDRLPASFWDMLSLAVEAMLPPTGESAAPPAPAGTCCGLLAAIAAVKPAQLVDWREDSLRN